MKKGVSRISLIFLSEITYNIFMVLYAYFDLKHAQSALQPIVKKNS